MSTEQNKANVKRFVEEVINKDQWDRVNEFVAPDTVDHVVPPGMPQNIEGTKMFFKAFRAAFPDFKYSIEDSIAEGDLVVQRVTGTGTMKGEMMGMKPSGKHATWQEIHIVRMQDGKIAEHWGNVDQMGMLTQLGFGPGA